MAKIQINKNLPAFQIIRKWVADTDSQELSEQLMACGAAFMEGLWLPPKIVDWLEVYCGGMLEEDAEIVLKAIGRSKTPVFFNVIETPLSDGVEELHAVMCNLDDYSDHAEALGMLENARVDALDRLDRAEGNSLLPQFEVRREDAKETIWQRFNQAEKELESHTFWGDEE